MDDDDVAFQQKKKAEEAALKAARDKGTYSSFFTLSSLPSLFTSCIAAAKGTFNLRQPPSHADGHTKS